MKIVVQVKLMPDAEQALALERTLHTVNEAANWVSAVAFEQGVPHEYELRKHTYAELKSRGLGAQAAQHVIKKVRDAYTTAFAQLGDFIVYKAKRAGVPVVFVDPAYTSRQCCECDHIDNKNRASQSLFICRNCGVVAHADRNASRNIARKGEAVWTAGRDSRAPATP